MQTGEWIKPGALNTIHYSIKLPCGETKTGVLRFTKSQQARFNELREKKENTDLDIALIALNPTHETQTFTSEQIESALDIDQIVLLNRIWLDRKVASPRLSRELDPKFEM